VAASSLVPYPSHVDVRGGDAFALDTAAVTGDPDAAAALARLLAARTGRTPDGSGGGRVVLRLGHDGPAESYALRADASGVEVVGADAAGLSYGVHTLSQLIEHQDGGWRVPAVDIVDAPRFAYRGMMLDVARHFFPVADVEAVIDRIAALKLNHLHLHLSDDQGWRLELRSRPALTERASSGAVGDAPGGFYRREDYARIVSYAATRHVTIVPEIDVPGHTHAVGLAHPEIAAEPQISDEVRATAERFGGGLPVAGEPYGGIAVGFSSLRTDDERTYAFLADVFGELAALTPGPYLHLGGDEALGTPPDAYARFVSRAVEIVAATGKTPVVWHEAAAVAGLPAAVVAQYWSFAHPSADPARTAVDAAAAEAARAAAAVILSPADAVYLDMKPEPGFPIGLEWAEGPTSLADAYGWEPADRVPGLDPARILGVEAPLWAETVRTLADVDALAFPRIAAAAEIAWSPPPVASAERTDAAFRTRLGALAPLWRAQGIGFTPLAGVPWRDA
jgi:hexosaminidase